MSTKHRLFIGTLLIIGGIPSCMPPILNIITHSKINTSLFYAGLTMIFAGLTQVVFAFLLEKTKRF